MLGCLGDFRVLTFNTGRDAARVEMDGDFGTRASTRDFSYSFCLVKDLDLPVSIRM